MHNTPHRLRGQVIDVLINGTYLVQFEVEDWADRVQTSRPDDDMVYGRVLNTPHGGLPLSRTFTDEQLQIRHA